jgi:hypothetical protein
MSNQPSNKYPGLQPLGDDAYWHFGLATFVATETTVEVPTQLDVVESAIALPVEYNGAAADGAEVMFCDRAITAGAVTFGRKVASDSATVTFSYMMFGRKWTAPA